MGESTLRCSETPNLLSVIEPPWRRGGIVEEIYEIRKAWVKALGYEPWEGYADYPEGHIHLEGWCLNGFGDGDGLSVDGINLPFLKGQKTKIKRGACWISSKSSYRTNTVVFKEDNEAIEYVIQKAEKTHEEKYTLALRIHRLNEILLLADKVIL